MFLIHFISNCKSSASVSGVSITKKKHSVQENFSKITVSKTVFCELGKGKLDLSLTSLLVDICG